MNFLPENDEAHPDIITIGITPKYDLQYYGVAPKACLSLELLEKISSSRLTMLKAISLLTGISQKNDKDYLSKIQIIFKKYESDLDAAAFSLTRWDSCQRVQTKKLFDEVSHFMLRIAFSKNDEISKWFVCQEVFLFKYRYDIEAPSSIKQFTIDNGLDLPIVDEDEKRKLHNELSCSTSSKAVSVIENAFYKVEFTKVLDLVRFRTAFIKQGYVYVPEQEVSHIIVTSFKHNIENSMKKLKLNLNKICADKRISCLIDFLIENYTNENYIPDYLKENNSDEFCRVSLANIEQMAKESFPPCMQHLHSNLKKNNHLKHFGRIQYGLFLKGAGMSMDEQIMFWRNIFTTVDADKFDRNYLYNIRYNYGQEGRRADFAPYSCLRIIKGIEPGPSDFHGCPFKHFDKKNLSNQLESFKMPSEDIEDIEKLVSENHYHIACSRFFESVHNAPKNTINITNPNEYFDLSRKQLRSLDR